MAKWNRDSVINAIAEFVIRYDRLPEYNEYNNTYGLPSFKSVKKYLGKTVGEYVKTTYPQLAYTRQEKNKHKYIKKLEEYISRTDRLPRPKDFSKKMTCHHIWCSEIA